MRSADDVTMPNDKVFPLMCWLQGHSPRWVSAMDHQYQMLEEWFRENETSCPHCESFACARENTQQHDSSVINTRKMQKINATLDKSKYCDIHKLIITMQKQCVTFFFGGGWGTVYMDWGGWGPFLLITFMVLCTRQASSVLSCTVRFPYYADIPNWLISLVLPDKIKT